MSRVNVSECSVKTSVTFTIILAIFTVMKKSTATEVTITTKPNKQQMIFYFTQHAFSYIKYIAC